MEVTQGEGLCGFYIRCPDGTSITVTLFVGKLRKGPISARFEHVRAESRGRDRSTRNLLGSLRRT